MDVLLYQQSYLDIYLESPVAIGEHPQHLDEIDKQLAIIAEAEDKLDSLESFQVTEE